MTLEELLDCSADELEKMTDAELTAYFAPFFNVTRPELVEKVSPVRKFEPVLDFKMQQKMKILQEAGLDLSGLLPTRRKK